jgi:zinc and cadmium transporter
MTITLTLFCLAIVGVSVLGGLLPLATLLTHTRLQVYLSFSAGAMLGAVFFHMLPEAVSLGGVGVLHWAALGLLALFFLERFFAFHHHESPADPDEPCPPHPHEHGHGRGHSAGLVVVEAPGGSRAEAKETSLHWGAAAFGLAAHSLAGGVALASAVLAGKEGSDGNAPGASLIGATGWGVFLATLIHKPADALTIVSLMLRAGAPRSRAHRVNLAFAAMIPLGVLLFCLGLRRLSPDAAIDWTAAALAFSGGTFLCIALSDLLPELQFHSHDRAKLSLALVTGFILMLLTALSEPDRPTAPAAVAPPATAPGTSPDRTPTGHQNPRAVSTPPR